MILQFLTVQSFMRTSYDFLKINIQGHPQKTCAENIQCRYAMCLAVVSGVFILLPTVSSQIPQNSFPVIKYRISWQLFLFESLQHISNMIGAYPQNYTAEISS